MLSTIHFHNSIPVNQTGWSAKASDRQNYDKYEMQMSPLLWRRTMTGVVVLSILSLSAYFIYLKCTQHGRQELANLNGRKIVHYVKSQGNQNSGNANPGMHPTTYTNVNTTLNKVVLVSQPLHHDQVKQKEEAAAYLKELADLPDHQARLHAIGADVNRSNKFNLVIEAFPFDSSKDSLVQLEMFDDILKSFKSFVTPGIQAKFRKIVAEKGLQIPIPSWRSRNPLEGEIVKIRRQSTYSLEGKEIPADSEPVDCFVLKGVDGDRFGVKIVSIEDPNPMVLVVKKNGEDHEVCVDKTEFAERLQLDPLYVGSNSNGKLAEYVAEQKTTVVLANYQRIFEKQKKNPSLALAPNVLIKAIKGAFLHRDDEFSPTKGMGVSFDSSFLLNDLRTALGNRKVVAGFRGDKLYLRDITNKVLLDKGGEAEIYKVEGIASKKSKVMKFFTESSIFSAQPSALPEAKIVEKLHEDYPGQGKEKNRVPGIQKPFHGVVSFITHSSSFQTLYDGNLNQALGFVNVKETVPTGPELFLNLDEKLKSFYRVLFGFNYCVNVKGLIHGDIKPLNIFFTKDATSGEIHLYLADFGSALLCNPNNLILPNYGKAWTSRYVLFEDKVTREELGKDLYTSSVNKLQDWQNYIEHCRQWDIFSMACVLAELLVPGKKYIDYHMGGYPQSNTFKRDVLENAHIPAKLCDLIEKMLQEDPKKRPKIDHVLSSFAEVMKDRGLSLETN